MAPSQSSPKTASKEELRLLWKMSGLAFQFGTEIIAGVLLGWGVDALFGTRPWGVVIGAITGILVGTLDLVRRAMQINRQMDVIQKPLAGRSGGAPISQEPEKQAGELVDPEFEEALDHDQWKRLQDRKLDPNRDDDDEHVRDHGT